ncbi:uncharacterized protein NEMAJ01_2194 [Nematocida major]|uniref:uncharacterized protein n=1 Tax=Nematocida major TaxID=1912982 RepID=UPI0020081637|nr:uncharacterized protein NEMAJ01_2194 [Nematocida major]KAH9387298.1 hypothetical protein NEMAJ01_2194 [Nematocida major]
MSANTVLVIDASAVINSIISQMDYAKGYIPQAVADELKCNESTQLISLHMCKIEVRDPVEKYVKIAEEKALEMGFSGLSKQDIQLAALALEISEENNSVFSAWITEESIQKEVTQVVAVSLDNALKSLMAQLGVELHDTFVDRARKYMLRCYTCNKTYGIDDRSAAKGLDFCRSCGYSTITRIGYTEVDGKVHLHLSKNYKFTEKILTTKSGKPIRSQDQKEYRWYRKSQMREEKKDQRELAGLMLPQNWDSLK